MTNSEKLERVIRDTDLVQHDGEAPLYLSKEYSHRLALAIEKADLLEQHNPVQGHWEAHDYNWEFIEGEGWFCKCGRQQQPEQGGGE